MIHDFMKSLKCVRNDEKADYQRILSTWTGQENVAFMPAIFWYGGTCNLFDQKAGRDGEDLIWLVPAGQCSFFWLTSLKKAVIDFYENDEINISGQSHFPGIDGEDLGECILLHSDDLQDDPEHTILGANVLLVRLVLTSGRSTLLFILLDHHDQCWKKVIEDYKVALRWFVDSGRGTDNYYIGINLYQLMKNTAYPELLPPLYFKGLFNKGQVPEHFKFRYAMLSDPEADGYDMWKYYSAVYDTGWRDFS